MKALIKKAFDEAFGRFDCLLGPVAPTTAPQLGKSLTAPLRMYLGDIYTISVNLAGLPAVSLPGGGSSDGLPIGLDVYKRQRGCRCCSWLPTLTSVR